LFLSLFFSRTQKQKTLGVSSGALDWGSISQKNGINILSGCGYLFFSRLFINREPAIGDGIDLVFRGIGGMIAHSGVKRRAGVILEINAYSARIELVDCLFFHEIFLRRILTIPRPCRCSGEYHRVR